MSKQIGNICVEIAERRRVYSASSGKVLYVPTCTLESANCFEIFKTLGMCSDVEKLLHSLYVKS